jgi:methionyl-tRNA formyltransferase
MDEIPGAWSELDGAAVKLYHPEVVALADLPRVPRGPTANGGSPAHEDRAPVAAGTVLVADAEAGLLVAAGDDAVRLGEVQPPGKRRMSALDWIHGRGVREGQRFE